MREETNGTGAVGTVRGEGHHSPTAQCPRRRGPAAPARTAGAPPQPPESRGPERRQQRARLTAARMLAYTSSASRYCPHLMHTFMSAEKVCTLRGMPRSRISCEPPGAHTGAAQHRGESGEGVQCVPHALLAVWRAGHAWARRARSAGQSLGARRRPAGIARARALRHPTPAERQRRRTSASASARCRSWRAPQVEMSEV